MFDRGDVELWPRVPKSKLGKQTHERRYRGARLSRMELLQVLREAVRDAGPPHWSEWTMKHAKMRWYIERDGRISFFTRNHGKHRPPSFYRPLPRNPQLPGGSRDARDSGDPWTSYCQKMPPSLCREFFDLRRSS